MPAAAVAGASIVGGMLSSRAQAKAGQAAANAQVQSSQMGIEEQRRQFDAVQELLKPYVEAGQSGLGGYQALAGASGFDAQRSAIDQLSRGPEFQALVGQGEDALLQNAAATGGLRGGNTQAALAQFRPQMLTALIEQQLGRYGGLASMGQNAAAGVGNAGMATGNNIAQLLGQQGAAQAGGILAQGKGRADMFGSIAQGIGQYFGGRF